MPENERLPVLVGAEGCAELDAEWFLDGGEGDRARFLEENSLTEERYKELTIDRNSRPYFLMVVLGSAPEWARDRARSHSRVVRLAT